MSVAGSIRAGAAFVELVADDSKLAKGLNAARARLSSFGDAVQDAGKKILAAGTAGLAAISTAVFTFADEGSKLFDMSARIGVSTEALSELAYAAEQSGASLENVEMGFRRMQRSVIALGEGTAAATRDFAALGLAFADLKDLAPDKQMELIADRIAAIADPAKRTEAAMAIFGRGGTTLLPAFIEGLSAARDEARRLGLTMTTEMATAADRVGDAYGRLKKVAKQTLLEIGFALAGQEENFANTLTSWVVAANSWIRTNRPMIVLASRVALAIAGVGAALIGLSVVFKGIGVAMVIPLFLLKGLAVTMGVLAGAVGFLLSPLGLLTAAVAGLGAAFFGASDRGRQAISSLGEGLASFGMAQFETIKTGWQGVVDAISNGDIEAAARIGLATLKILWNTTVNGLTDLWTGFTDSMQDAWSMAQEGALTGLFNFGTSAENVWERVVTGFRLGWHGAIMWLVNFVADAGIAIMESLQPFLEFSGIDFSSAIQGLHDWAAEASNARQATMDDLSREHGAQERFRERTNPLVTDPIAAAFAEERRLRDARREAERRARAATLESERADAMAALEALTEEQALGRLQRELVNDAFGFRAGGRPPGGEDALSNLSSVGTFNASAAGLLSGGPLDRIAQNGEAANAHLHAIRRQLERGDNLVLE